MATLNTQSVENTHELLESAYQQCERLAHTHYENFPVASRFLPKKIRRAIAVIYAFARRADDIADEGDLSQVERLEQLDMYWRSLEAISLGILPDDPVFVALNDVFKKHPNLPIQLFFDLLTAFKQDVVKHEYKNFEEVLYYCKHSANPIGQLLLYLTDNATPENLNYSDNICTALQLINFLQDLDSDLNIRNRCYLPQDEMANLNVSKKNLIDYPDFVFNQLLRAERLLKNGAPLGKNLKGLFGFEIRLMINAGQAIVECLKNRKRVYDRPTLKPWHWPRVLIASIK